MAVQIPNLGNGDGETGDNELVIRQKYNSNFNEIDGELNRLSGEYDSKFSDQSNAASRKVGRSNGNVTEYMAYGIGNTGWGGTAIAPLSGSLDIDSPPTIRNGAYAIESYYFNGSYGGNLPVQSHGVFVNLSVSESASSMEGVQLFIQRLSNKAAPAFYYRTFDHVSAGVWVKTYTDVNTTLDGNGALKPSSPVLRVFNDRIEGNADGDEMAATYIKNGVGDYTISGTTGLRTDGWYIVIPNDMNGNPKVAVTLDDTDGVITLKTYVRIFDMTTFKFVPDLDQPLDIPDGRWIDLRFNDLPAEPMPQEV